MRIKVTGQKKLRVVGREDLPKAVNGLNFDPPAEPTTPGNFYVYGPNGEILQEKDQFGNLVKDFSKQGSPTISSSSGSTENNTQQGKRVVTIMGMTYNPGDPGYDEAVKIVDSEMSRYRSQPTTNQTNNTGTNSGSAIDQNGFSGSPTTQGNFYVYGPNGEITKEMDQNGNLVKDFTNTASSSTTNTTSSSSAPAAPPKTGAGNPWVNLGTSVSNTQKDDARRTEGLLNPGTYNPFDVKWGQERVNPEIDITGPMSHKPLDRFGTSSTEGQLYPTRQTSVTGGAGMLDTKNLVTPYTGSIYNKPAKTKKRTYREYNSAVPSLITAGMAMTNDLLKNTLNYNDEVDYAKKVGQTNASEPTVKNVYSRGRHVMNVPLGADYAPNMMTPVQFRGRPVSEFTGFPGYGRNIASSKYGGGTPMFPDGGEPCYDAQGNVIPCEDKRLSELGSDAYTAMQPIYDTIFEAANKYKNPETGMVSPFNSLRAKLKGVVKHPEFLFMKKYDLPDEEADPYHTGKYIVDRPGNSTMTWWPDKYAQPRRQRNTGGGEWWQENVKNPFENFKEKIKTRRGIKNQQGCYGANCYENDMQDQAKHGGLFKAAEGTAFTESLGLPTLVENPNDYLGNNIPDMKGPELPAYERPQAQQQSEGVAPAPTEVESSSEASMGFAMPLKSIKITSGFGHRNAPLKGASTEHNGVDLYAPVNTPVFSPLDGTIEKIYYNNKGGKQLVIRHSDGSRSGYAHLNDYDISIGDKVSKGQRVALSGNTGNSTGAHLHFTYRNSEGNLVDPSDFFNMGSKNKSMKGVSNLDHNNPGNIHIGGFAKGYGATAGRNDSGGKVAVFPDMQTGMKAMEDLIFGNAYNNLTISEARNKWVNGSPSVPNSSTNSIVSAMGGNYRLNQLNSSQRKKLMSEFIKWEDRGVYSNLKSKGLVFKEGGEYELEDDEINYILANGGQVEYL